MSLDIEKIKQAVNSNQPLKVEQEDIVTGRPPTKDELIVRQTCLKVACEYGANREFSSDTVKDIAQSFEEWVWRQVE